MTECEECLVTSEMGQVLRLSRIFGIAPVNITRARISEEFNMTATVNCYHVSASKKYGIISSVLLLIIWIICFMNCVYVTGIMDPEKAIRIRTGLSLVLYGTHGAFHDVVLLFMTFRGLNKVRMIISYLNYIQKLNRALKNDYLNLKIKKSKIIVWGYSLTIVIITFIFICQRTLDVVFGKKSVAIIILQLLYFLSFSMHILIQLQFAFVVYLVNATIRVFNDRLKSWNYKWDYEFNNIIISKRKHITFRRLCQIYLSICKLITTIDKHESVFIFLLLSYKVLDLLDSLYLIMSSLLYFTLDPANIVTATFIDFAVEVLWIIYRGAALVLLIEPFNQTDIELRALKSRLSYLILMTNKNYKREKLFIFCRQLIINLPVFSPLGICSFRRHGLVTIIGALFTFVVIITQFRLRDGIGYYFTTRY